MTFSFQSLSFQLDVYSADTLVVKQNNYPKWVAEVDGMRTPLHSAYGTFIAMPIPAGRHEVTLSFTNNRIRYLLLLEFSLLLLTTIALLWTSKDHRIRYIFP